MKNRRCYLEIFVLSFFVLCIGISCSTVKKTALDCPDLSSNRYYKAERSTPVHRKLNAYRKVNTLRYSSSNSKRNKKVLAYAGPAIVKETPKEIINLSKAVYNRSLTALLPVENSGTGLIVIAGSDIRNTEVTNETRTDAESFFQSQKCDTIVLRSGAKHIGKVEEIGLNEIKYRRCDNLTGPLIALLKSDVNVIKYSNGTNDYFTSNDYIPSVQASGNAYSADNRYAADNRKNHGLGVAGFITSLAGLFVFSIPLGILSVVFGAVSLGKIRKNPSRYKGKGFAIAALIIGLVDIAAMIILLSSVTVY